MCYTKKSNAGLWWKGSFYTKSTTYAWTKSPNWLQYPHAKKRTLGQLQASKMTPQNKKNLKMPQVCFHTVDPYAYLEDKHLSPKYGEGVEASVADVGFGIGVGWSVSRGQPWRSCLPVWLAGVWGRMGAGRGSRRQRLGGLGNLIRGPWRESEKNNISLYDICNQNLQSRFHFCWLHFFEVPD